MTKSNMRRGESPTTVATSFLFDIQKFFDCNNSLDLVDDEEDDDLSSALSNDQEERREPILDSFPEEFRVQSKWPHLSEIPTSTIIDVQNEEDISRIMACRCINARGAIAHGKRPGLMYEAADVTQTSVEEIFTTFGEGAKALDSTREIKHELMTSGPVVSTSFKLSKNFADKTEFASYFLMSLIGETHPLLITGWKLTEFGEVWIIDHLDGGKDHIIAFGHFGIDRECLAPKGSFENTPWQAGPYFDHDFSRVAEDWRQWPNLKMYLKSNDLERLAACFETGFVSAVASESHFELCDRYRRAHSRTCCLKEVGWDGERSKWRVTAGFVDENLQKVV